MRAGRPWETTLRPRSGFDTRLFISLSVAALIAASAAHAGLGAAIDTSEVTRHDVEVQLGVTGDLAGGEVLQRFWHGLTNSPEPHGWDNQLGPDPGVNGYYNFQHIHRCH